MEGGKLMPEGGGKGRSSVRCLGRREEEEEEGTRANPGGHRRPRGDPYLRSIPDLRPRPARLPGTQPPSLPMRLLSSAPQPLKELVASPPPDHSPPRIQHFLKAWVYRVHQAYT